MIRMSVVCSGVLMTEKTFKTEDCKQLEADTLKETKKKKKTDFNEQDRKQNKTFNHIAATALSEAFLLHTALLGKW